MFKTLEFVLQMTGTMNGFKQGSEMARFAFQIDQAGSYVKNGLEEEKSTANVSRWKILAQSIGEKELKEGK